MDSRKSITEILRILDSAAERSEPLAAIKIYTDGDLADGCVGVCFEFPTTKLFAYPDQSDDSIILSERKPDLLSDLSIREQCSSDESRRLVGRPLFMAWAMTNNHGRVDGVQMEFGTADKLAASIQLLVFASTLVLRRATPPIC